MIVYIQVEYTLDEDEIESLKGLGITKKDDILNYINSNLDMSMLDDHLGNAIALDMEL